MNLVEKTFSRWVEVPEAIPVKFADLPVLMAHALHPEPFAQGAARLNLETELQHLVDAGKLVVRDALTLGRHTFPVGDALRESVLLPREDLPALLEPRGIGLRLTPYGSGPTHWTIANAAAAIAAQEGWHIGARDTFRAQMMQAARDGLLVVRHPHTDTMYRPEVGRDFYELVVPADVNTWLEADPHRVLRWQVDSPEQPIAAQKTVAETSDQRCARLLRWLREEQAKQPRGALARVVKRDGRARQTVSADIAKGREKEATDAGPIARVARIVRR